MTTFDEFMADLAEEARAEGADAVAELDAFGLRFSLARQLAARRRALHLTQRQLAERTAIERCEMDRIERGEVELTAATLGTLTHALGVEVRLVPTAERAGQAIPASR